MAACAFFSNKKENHNDFDLLEAIEMVRALEEIFKALILRRDVVLFYTPGETPFDRHAAVTVFKLKQKYNREYYGIQLIKIAGKDDIGKEVPPLYDRYCYFKSDDYKDKCEFALRVADFLVLDVISQKDKTNQIFSHNTLHDSLKHDEVEILDVEFYMSL